MGKFTLYSLYKKSRKIYLFIVIIIGIIISYVLKKSINEKVVDVYFKKKFSGNDLKCIDRLINMITTEYIILLIAIIYILYMLYKIEYSNRVRKVSFLFAVFLSVNSIFGYSFMMTNSWDMVIGSTEDNLKSVLIIICLIIVYKVIIQYLIEKIIPKICNTSEKEWKILKPDKKNMVLMSIVIFCAWIPYIVINYPANMTPDSRDEMAQIFGNEKESASYDNVLHEEGDLVLNNHHPVGYTLFIGAFIKIGLAVNDINIGIFLCSIVQAYIIACIYAYCIKFMGKIQLPVWLRKFAILFFALFPINAIYAITITKDGLFAAFLLYTTIAIAEILFFEKEEITKNNIIITMLMNVFMLLTRNNGIYILIVLFFSLIVILRKNKIKLKKVLIMFGVPIIFFILFSKILLPTLKIRDGSKREMLSLPFMQIARYASEYGEEGFEDGEIETVDKVLKFNGNIDVLKRRYNPLRSDLVKNSYNKECSSEDLKELFSVWIKLVERHPGTCIQATWNMNYCLFSEYYNEMICYYNVLENGREWFGLTAPKNLENERNVATKVFLKCSKIPGISLLFGVGFWSCLVLMCIVYNIYIKKYASILVYMPSLLNILICILGPVIYVRYSIQWMVQAPLLIGFVLYQERERNIKKNQ